MFSHRAAPIGAEGSLLCGAAEADEAPSADVSSLDAEPEPEPPTEGIFGSFGALGIWGDDGALGIEILPLGKPTISTYLVAETGLIEDEEAQGEDQ